jgi:esterase
MIEDEFAQLGDVAVELGRPAGEIPAVRRVGMPIGEHEISGICWGPGEPEVVFLHGGSQNAHTWDAVALELNIDALALDLPGHGHSSWRPDHDYSATTNAPAVAAAVAQWAPTARLVVGMSLGGLTLTALSVIRPELVRRAVLVDILPMVPGGESHSDRQRLSELREKSGRQFRSREEMVDQVVSVARRRDPSSLERGVVHNSVRDSTGWWRWRYDPDRTSWERGPEANDRLWGAVARLPEGSMLVRGELSTFVGPESLRRLAAVAPWMEVETIANAGHSIQGDQPLRLARTLRKALNQTSQQVGDQQPC